MTNCNWGNEINMSAKYGFSNYCNYNELHVTCRMGCLIESKATSNFNCGNEIMWSAKYGFSH